MPGVDEAKRDIRERIWSCLEREHVVSPGVRGHIPAFVGADSAAELLTTLPAWRVNIHVPASAERAWRSGDRPRGRAAWCSEARVGFRLVRCASVLVASRGCR